MAWSSHRPGDVIASFRLGALLPLYLSGRHAWSAQCVGCGKDYIFSSAQLSVMRGRTTDCACDKRAKAEKAGKAGGKATVERVRSGSLPPDYFRQIASRKYRGKTAKNGEQNA